MNHKLEKHHDSQSLIRIRARMCRDRMGRLILGGVLCCAAVFAAALDLPWEIEPTPPPGHSPEPAPAAGDGAALFEQGLTALHEAMDEKGTEHALSLLRQSGYLAELRRGAESGDATAQYHLYWAAEFIREGPAVFAEDMAELPDALASGEISEQEAAGIRAAYRAAQALAGLFREAGLAADPETSLRWLRRAAEQGHDEAQHELGSRYERGAGVPEDKAEAVRWYRRAAEQGCVRGQISLASAYRTGSGVPQDKAEAIRWLRRVADRNDPWGHYNLGDLYFEQNDHAAGMRAYSRAAELWRDDRPMLRSVYQIATVRLDSTDSIEAADRSAYQAQMLSWLRRLVELGDVGALSSIGSAYALGHGVPRDDAEAVRWYRRAAEQGCANGEYYLGEAYEHGRGVPRDRAQALAWYRRAHAQGRMFAGEQIEALTAVERAPEPSGNPVIDDLRLRAEAGEAWAQNNLGFRYERGDGVAQDRAAAVRWYRRAAEQGHAWSQYSLGQAYMHGEGIPQDRAEAVRWYRRAAEQGHAWGQIFLGHAYRDGHGVVQDHAEAVSWYRRAAAQGNASAQNNLGRAYEHGRGVPQDRAQALVWYRKAHAQGNEDAGKKLEELTRTGQ